jgi:hypothetical protein
MCTMSRVRDSADEVADSIRLFIRLADRYALAQKARLHPWGCPPIVNISPPSVSTLVGIESNGVPLCRENIVRTAVASGSIKGEKGRAKAMQVVEVLVWDPFVRIFHWLLASTVLFDWAADEPRWLHVWLGYLAGVLVLLRPGLYPVNMAEDKRAEVGR